MNTRTDFPKICPCIHMFCGQSRTRTITFLSASVENHFPRKSFSIGFDWFINQPAHTDCHTERGSAPPLSQGSQTAEQRERMSLDRAAREETQVLFQAPKDTPLYVALIDQLVSAGARLLRLIQQHARPSDLASSYGRGSARARFCLQAVHLP